MNDLDSIINLAFLVARVAAWLTSLYVAWALAYDNPLAERAMRPLGGIPGAAFRLLLTLAITAVFVQPLEHLIRVLEGLWDPAIRQVITTGTFNLFTAYYVLFPSFLVAYVLAGLAVWRIDWEAIDEATGWYAGLADKFFILLVLGDALVLPWGGLLNGLLTLLAMVGIRL
ncbi:MAG: hypothetical protein KKA73_01045 [Chloroflexi bacterium]|nr:hypothetical protein [Chloroflexota bacterium]MBU1746250.1 hypothetical protein [Chloroflexota bacterium]